MPGATAYGLELAVELGIGRSSEAGHWGAGVWGRARWGESDTTVGDWVDVTCDVLDGLRLSAGSNTDDGVTRRWESASAGFTLDGPTFDPWNGPYADTLGDRTPARVRWRYPPDPPPVVVGTNLMPNPSYETNLTGVTAVRATATRAAAAWGAGGWALRLTPNTVGNSSSYAWLRPGGATNPYLPGHTYTVIATLHLDAALTGTLDPASRLLLVFADTTRVAQSVAPPNTPGTYPVRLTWTMPTTAYTTSDVRLVAGAASGGGAVDIDKVMLWEGPDDGRAYYDGDTPDTAGADYRWTGVAHASTSQQWTTQPHTGTWSAAFTGFVATRGYSWDADQVAGAVACVDGTSVLVASDGLPRPPAGAGESAAARVARIASAALWPGTTDITAGGTPVQATTLDAAAWTELLEVADTDLALLWVNRAGALAFRPRGRVGQGTVLAGRLVVCPAGPGDIAVMTLGRNQPSVTRNRVAIARRKDETVPGDVPVAAQLEDRQSVARFQAHDFKRTDLWHTTDGWSATVAQAVLGAGAWPSPAPGELLLDTVTGDARVGPLLLSLEPDQTFDVVDDGGRVWREAVVGWDIEISHDEIEGLLRVEDVTRWTNVGKWGTAKWGTSRWGIGGI